MARVAYWPRPERGEGRGVIGGWGRRRADGLGKGER